MIMFTIKLNFEGSDFNITYDSIEECLGDKALKTLLESNATCQLWNDKLKLSSKPIDTADQLKKILVSNSNIIYRKIL